MIKAFFRKYDFIILLTVILIILFIIIPWDKRKGRNDNKIIEPTELTELRGRLSGKPTIIQDEDGSRVRFKLMEHPDITFYVNDIKYHALQAGTFLKESSAGDSIVLGILRYDYDTKIKQIKPLRLSEQIIDIDLIEPYTIQLDGKTYMRLADVNKAWREEQDITWWMAYWVSGTMAVAGLLYLVLRITGVIKKIKTWMNSDG